MGTYQKRGILHAKKWRKPSQQGEWKGAMVIKLYPMHRGWSTIWNNYTTEALLQNENSESWQWEEEPERIYLWGLLSFDHRNSTRLETKTSTLEGTHRVLCAQDPGKISALTRDCTRLICSIGGYPMKMGVGAASECSLLQNKNTGGSNFGEYSLAEPSPEVAISSPDLAFTQ